jgi:iron-sulfur cluster repair protein YtfE (RIC family)
MTVSLITADTPVRTALRLRPRLADNLAAFGSDLWDRPQAPLRELFRNRDTLEKFLGLAAAAPVPAADSAWNDLPAAHLADHLTHNHRDFLMVLIPDILGFFTEWGSPEPAISDLRGDFEAFTRGLRAEIESEEHHFFPRVLRYDACLRDPSINPEFNGGSLRVAVAYRNSHAPGLHPDRLRNLIDRLEGTHAAEDGNAWADLLITRLEDFHAQYAEHERLEAQVLYPMAMDMEKTLYNLSIAGVGRHSTVVA